MDDAIIIPLADGTVSFSVEIVFLLTLRTESKSKGLKPLVMDYYHLNKGLQPLASEGIYG
jgi:hypothetical protein